ncbi:DUF4190 domain-containing protein [Anaerobacillus isosaccharinicus]|uniref:DUF4190 domain-containing protein n=1 Tax=Anaerobacillus isosaccharinicus TaxID=1532552 RepID=A0A7S7RD69_9BACI|nr:DUF4190 domain-containing protein [Anaerobacillus isosaccharinicus]MBA5588881.1 DUF4190 domain-containing protein [Anaerobacillus isosaccharinicus]QOY37732.1 DUF4190 domain-containing protein [Anaerobacillus isosaccharinicus]
MSEQANEQVVTHVVVQQQEGNGMATAGLVLGIIGVVLNFIPFLPYILGGLAIIFGVVGMKKPIKKGVAKAGLILGIVTIALKISFWLFLSALFSGY